jgi:hypothetical protein
LEYHWYKNKPDLVSNHFITHFISTFACFFQTQNMPALSGPQKYILPDLIADCVYPLRVNRHCYEVARASERWLLEGANHSPKKAKAFMGLRAGELTAACYPDANAFHLRVCTDFMNYLFNLDDWLDEFDVKDTNGMAACCLNALRNPHTFQTDKAAGKMSMSCVLIFI